ncbi:MAG: hypothetical protein V4760_01355 [Bdellovibrionota bacterium]
MSSGTFKFAVIGMLAVAFIFPSIASARKSKLRIVSDASVEHRFRKPGAPRVRALKRKAPAVRSPAKRARPSVTPVEGPVEITIQAHRRAPLSPVVQESMSTSFRSMPVAGSRLTKNNLSIEMLGRGGLYSLDYDRQLGRDVSMGLGFSNASLRMNADAYAAVNATLITVPIYGNFYFNDHRKHRFLGTGGVTIVSAKAEASVGVELAPEAKEVALSFVNDLDLSTNASVVLPMPVGGAGYEYKSTGGFLARASVYVVYVGSIQPWAGLALGSHF